MYRKIFNTISIILVQYKYVYLHVLYFFVFCFVFLENLHAKYNLRSTRGYSISTNAIK